ncbi:MAG: SRPBCC domain-containing protein [Chloroflexi bacterium]|nr:SRPBCC domain-containing protein [Chloroflexota bacterium]
MKQFRVTKTINAPPETIWAILTDAPSYPEWDPGMIRLEGRIAPGEKVKAVTRLNPKRAFPAKVSEFVPNQTMTWSGGMPLGLFKGERTFTLAPKGDGATEFSMREAFSGPLLFLIGRTIPDLSPSFEDFANGLKARAEKGS